MKVKALTLAMSLLLLGIWAAPDPAPAQTSDFASVSNIRLYPQPLKIRNLVLKDCGGRTVALSDYRKRVVLLHFWSIQCPACRIEEPVLASLKRAFGPQELEVLGVNLVDPPNLVLQHVLRNRFPFPVLFDGSGGFNLRSVDMGGKRTAFLVNPQQEAILEIPGLPTTYIIDCRGDAVGYSVGATQWNDRSAVGLIRRLISESRTCAAESSARYSASFPLGQTFF
jgi:thiol-disulfide isomerase/thioredoxin